MPADTGARANGAKGDFPAAFYAIIRGIDRFSDITGRLISLAMVFLVAIITYEVFARYLFRAPTAWVYELSYMANGAAFMLGCAYALSEGRARPHRYLLGELLGAEERDDRSACRTSCCSSPP